MAEQTRDNLESEFTPIYRFWTDKAFYFLFLLAVLANAALFGIIVDAMPQLPERLPILFNAQGQADLVANKASLYRLPLGAGLLIFINGAIAAILLRESAFAARMLMLASFWIGLLLMAGIWFIIR
jgi:uncharacterized membrane protein